MIVYLSEINRSNLVGKTKDQGNGRYQRRTRYKPDNFRGTDVSQLFDNDVLICPVPVGDYTSTVAFQGVLLRLRDQLKEDPRHTLTLQKVIKAITKAIDSSDLLVDCTCPDFCLHKDTKIKLLNGKVVTVEEMCNMFQNNEELWVYSTDENGDFKPGEVSNVWISGYTTEYIEITLDNNEKIRTTPNHEYMLRDGSYLRADELQIGQSLMPLYFSYHNGYESVKTNSIKDKTIFKSVYKIVANEVLSDKINEAKIRSGEDIIAIHHSDFDKLNNYPSNLNPMGKLEHWNYHAKLTKDKNPEQMRKFIEAGLNYWRTSKGRKQKSEEMSKSIKDYWKNMSIEERQKISEQRRQNCPFNSDTMKNYWNNLDDKTRKKRNRINSINLNGINGEKASKRIKNYYKNVDKQKLSESRKNLLTNLQKEGKTTFGVKGLKFSDEHRKNISNSKKGNSSNKGKIKKLIERLISDEVELTEDNYNYYRKTINDYKFYPNISTYYNSFEEALEELNIPVNYNHKVLSVERIVLDNPEPVYDISVENYHNFYVNAGVMLHNCYRFAYWATKYGYKYGKPETRPAKKTNPNDKIGAMCKHLTALLANKKWVVKIASIINDYINEYPDEARRAMGLSEDEMVINTYARRLGKMGYYAKLFDRIDNDEENNKNSQNNSENNSEDSDMVDNTSDISNNSDGDENDELELNDNENNEEEEEEEEEGDDI